VKRGEPVLADGADDSDGFGLGLPGLNRLGARAVLVAIVRPTAATMHPGPTREGIRTVGMLDGRRVMAVIDLLES